MTKPRKIDEAEAVRLYESGLSQYEVGLKLGVTQSAINRVLKRAGVEARPRTKVPEDRHPEIESWYREGQSLNTIAGRLNVSQWVVANILKERGVKRRRRGAVKRVVDEALADKIVDLYESGLSQDQVVIAINGAVKQGQVSRVLRQRGVKMRSGHGARGDGHHAYRGGRTRTSGGYTAVLVAEDDPMAPMRNRMGYVPEHRLIMARAFGRPLERWQTVHHINGDRSDNRLANLQLRVGSHGAGIALRCEDCGSHNVGAVPLK